MLHIRHFQNPADAVAAEHSREVAPERGAMKRCWTPARLAKAIGVSKRTINQRCADGDLPFIDQGTSKRQRRFIKPEIVAMIKERGLGGVARMRQAGLLGIGLVLFFFCGARVQAADVVTAAVDRPADRAAWTLMRVTGRSMCPDFPPGTWAIVVPVRAEQLSAGDVIVFHSYWHGYPVMHRAIRREGRWWVTKGDANGRQDLRLVSNRNLIGRVEAVCR